MNNRPIFSPILSYVNKTISFATLLLIVIACDSNQSPESGSDASPNPPSAANVCELPTNQIVSGGPGKDGIPALTDPMTVGSVGIDFLKDDDRVIGLIIDGRPVAVPHNVLWWHEIANFSGREKRLAATYCPLTGSSIVFDRKNIGDAELGVSGLLYQNNLIMYDRNEEEALWSQMLTGANCDSEKGVPLTTVAHIEMTWAGWKSLYPETEVISSETGFSRNYTRYPYGNYEEEENDNLLFRQSALDTRRPPKERTLGIPAEDGSALVFPFGLLNAAGNKQVVATTFKNKQVLVLWDGDKQAAAAFEPFTADGSAVAIKVEAGEFVDESSGATFEVNGKVMVGDMAGTSLRPVPEAYVAFWFAWPAFHPDVRIYDPAS